MAVVAASWVGQLLAGRYRVTAKLGEGGMAFVYRAHDERMDAEVVIKAPRPALLDDPEFADRFRREVRALVRLAHPHIARVSDVGDHAGVPFAVMDYLAGGSLQDRRMGADGQSVPQSPESLRGWLAEVAAALDFIHAAHHVHRDVKPDNILFDAYGKVYLSDFGVVKSLEASGIKTRQTVLTSAGMVLGTPQYMAPEVIMGEHYDGRADQYALAVTVHDLLGGAPPFNGATPAAVLMDRMSRAAPSLQESVTGLPKALAAAVRKGLAKDPRDRHADCAAFARALLETLEATPAGKAMPTRSRKQDALPVATPAATCPACGKLLGIPARMWGKQVKCPSCRKTFQAPMLGKATPAGGIAQRAETRSARQALVDTAKASVVRRRNRKRLVMGGMAVGAVVVLAFYLFVGWLVMAGGRVTEPRNKVVAPFPPASVAQADPPTDPRPIEPTPPSLQIDPTPVPMPVDAPTASVPVKPPPELHLLPIAAIAIEAGQSQSVAVRVDRHDCKGPIELRLEGLPNGVQVRPAVILAETDAGQVELIAALDAIKGSQMVRVIAIAADARTDGQVQFEVTGPLAKEITSAIGMKLVLIPAGKFTMGSPSSEEGRDKDDETQHEVRIPRPFYMGVYPVTEQEYEKVMGSKQQSFMRYLKESTSFDEPYYWPAKSLNLAHFPMEMIQWIDAVAFCESLNKSDAKRPAGWEYGLPTEAEWEYACRGGTTTAYSFGDDPKQLGDYAWYKDNSLWYKDKDGKQITRVHEVGTKKPNRWGLYDMHGNVWQWCSDWIADYDGDTKSFKDPNGPDNWKDLKFSGQQRWRILRGGSFQESPSNCRSAFRKAEEQANCFSEAYGFRVALHPVARTP